jgi:hypothetical protein
MPRPGQPAHVPPGECQQTKLYRPLIIVSNRQFYPLWVNFALLDNGGEAAGFPHERVKAIGWALRQYGSIDPVAVQAFVAQHGNQLSGLSKREALRRMG